MRTSVPFLFVLLAVMALIAGFALARPFDRHSPVEEARAERIHAETEVYRAREEVLQPIKAALYAVLGGTGILAAGLGTWAGFLYLRRRALTVYPDHNGVMPALIVHRGDFVVDLGTLAGPLTIGQDGPAYRLPSGDIPWLQAAANQGAAATRTMRAWATRQVAPKQETPPWPRQEITREFPPVEVLTGDEAHILRLLEEGER